MSRSNDELALGNRFESGNSHESDGNVRSSGAEEATYITDPTTKRRKFSLSKKQRMHWRKQNDNRADSRIKHTKKYPRDAAYDAGGDYHESDGGLKKQEESDSVDTSSDKLATKSDGTVSTPVSSSSSNNRPTAQAAILDTSRPALGTFDIKTNQMEIIEVGDSDEENREDTNEAAIKRNNFVSEDQSMFTGNSHGQTQHKYALEDHQYSYRSSAYVQHIAEACTLIMTDARWRTCKKPTCVCRSIEPSRGSCCHGKTLLSWEDGDDLSAVKAFISLYDGNVKRSMDRPSINKAGNIEESKTNSDETDQLLFERAMYLYSRMFHRKGPWFDLTDLYTRYYAPKKSTQQSSDSEQGENGIIETLGSYEDAELTNGFNSEKIDSAPKVSKRKRQSFFAPTSLDNKPNSATPTSSQQSQFTNEIHRHRRALEIFFTDICRLSSMGLVRTFCSEYECGLIAGNLTMGNKKRGTLLLAEERREVLRRLGCVQSTKATASGDGSRCRNEILSQMQKQHTMFSSYSPLDGSQVKIKDKRMLPVRKHVDHVLIRKFAFKVASLASREDKPRKSDVDVAFRLLNESWKFARNNALMRSKDCALAEEVTCTLRLREAPLVAVRRVLRLFLCASGGPGRMRDVTYGWLNVTTAYSEEEGFWHNVTYPGLSSRLGLASFELKHCYSFFPAEPERMDPLLDSSFSIPRSLRVFRHQSDFTLFEIGVDIRSFINTATESYELDRINCRRKMASATEEIREEQDNIISVEAPLSVQSVRDEFGILTVGGRKKFVQRILANFIDAPALSTFQLIESDIMSLHHDQYGGSDGFANDTERMIVALFVGLYRCDEVDNNHERLMGCTRISRIITRRRNKPDFVSECLFYDLELAVYKDKSNTTQ